jgi:hypothetical protein
MLKSLQRPGASAIPAKSATDQQTILVRIRAGPDPPGAARRIARTRQHGRRLGPGVSKGDETGRPQGAHSGRSGGSGDRIAAAGLRIASTARVRRRVCRVVRGSMHHRRVVALPIVSATYGCVTGCGMIRSWRVSPTAWRLGSLRTRTAGSWTQRFFLGLPLSRSSAAAGVP